MTAKKKYFIGKIIFIIISATIIFLSMISFGYAKPVPVSLINITIPSEIGLEQSSNGAVKVSSFEIENKSIMDFVIGNITTSQVNGWSLVKDKSQLQLNEKKLYLNIENQILNNGENASNITIKSNENKPLNIQAQMGVFTKSLKEKALNLSMEYAYLDREFNIEFDTAFEDTLEPINALSGSKVTLPKPENKYATFLYWKDIYTNEIYTDSLIMPVGGTKLLAMWKENNLDLEKLANIGPMQGGGLNEINQTSGNKTIKGIHLKTASSVPMDHQMWDISCEGDNSVIAYREGKNPEDLNYNQVTIAAKSNNIHMKGKMSMLFASSNHSTPLEYFRSDQVYWKILDGKLDQTFRGCKKLTDITALEYLDTSNVTTLFGTFNACVAMKDYTPIKNWDTKNVTDMSYLCCLNQQLETCQAFENWQTSKVTNIENIFNFDVKLKYADLSKWDLDSLNYTPKTGSFAGCSLEVAKCKKVEYFKYLNYRLKPNSVKFTVEGPVNEQQSTL